MQAISNEIEGLKDCLVSVFAVAVVVSPFLMIVGFFVCLI